MATVPVCAEQDDHIGSGFGVELEKPITGRDYSVLGKLLQVCM